MRTHASSNSGSSFSRSSFSHYSSASSSCSSPLSPCSSVDIAAFVPFLWEEKPGISKQYSQNKEWQSKASPVSTVTKSFMVLHVSEERRKTILTPANDLSRDIRPLRPPPSMRKSSHFGNSKSEKVVDVSASYKGYVRVLSQSFPRSRQPRKLKPVDDPFLLAIEACRKQANCKVDSKDTFTNSVKKLPRKDSRSSWTSAHFQEHEPAHTTYVLRSFSTESEDSATSTARSDRVPATYRTSTARSGVVPVKYVNPAQNTTLIARRSREQLESPPYHSRTSQMQKNSRALKEEKTSRIVKVSREADENLGSTLRNRAWTPSSSESCSSRKLRSAFPNEKQGQSVQLSCGHQRSLHSSRNKPALVDWLGCRSLHGFEGVVDPSKAPRLLITGRAR